MYGNSLPRYSAAGHGRKGASGTAAVACLVLLLASGGLGWSLIVTRAQIKELHHTHEVTAQELSHARDALHRVEAQKSADAQHFHTEINTCHATTARMQAAQDQIHLESKQYTDQLAAKTKELQEMHSLIDAWKRHLADEATLHRTREDNWQQLQSQWETIEKEMQNEILTLRQQLQAAKLAAPASKDWHLPTHMNPEVPRPDPVIPGATHTIHHDPQPVPASQDLGRRMGVADPHASTQHQQQQQQQQQQQHVDPHAQHQQQHDPHAQQHHDVHGGHDAHHETPLPNDHHEWKNHWPSNDYFDGQHHNNDPHHTYYADYPGFVPDDTHHDQHQWDAQHHDQQHGQHQDQQHDQHHWDGQHHDQQHDQHQWDNQHHDQHQWDAQHHDQHQWDGQHHDQQQWDAQHHDQQHDQHQWDAQHHNQQHDQHQWDAHQWQDPNNQHHDAHHYQPHGQDAHNPHGTHDVAGHKDAGTQGHGGQAGHDWHHEDWHNPPSIHNAPAPQPAHDPHAHNQHATHEAHHGVHDDLSWKLGMGGDHHQRH
eukprot:jgi/Chrzof1/36/Cz01g01060.t1